MSVELYGLTFFAQTLGGNWNPKKLSVYYSRGKLPIPTACAGLNGTRPLWTKEQIDKFYKIVGKQNKL